MLRHGPPTRLLAPLGQYEIPPDLDRLLRPTQDPLGPEPTGHVGRECVEEYTFPLRGDGGECIALCSVGCERCRQLINDEASGSEP